MPVLSSRAFMCADQAPHLEQAEPITGNKPELAPECTAIFRSIHGSDHVAHELPALPTGFSKKKAADYL